MIKIGSSDVDTIKIGATDVDKVMLGGVEIYPTPIPNEDPCGGDPITSGFLTHYTNPEYTAIPENSKHRLYPMGGVMPIAYWGTNNQSDSDLVRLADNGFTVWGCNHGQGADTPGDMARSEYAATIGLRTVAQISGYSNSYTDTCAAIQNDGGAAQIDSAKNRLLNYIDPSRWEAVPSEDTWDNVDLWLIRPEEAMSRVDYVDDPCTHDSVGRYFKDYRLMLNANDPQLRPMFTTNLQEAYTVQWQIEGASCDAHSAQTYNGSVFRIGSPTPSGCYPSARTQTVASEIKAAIDGQVYDPAVPTYRKNFAYPLFGPYFEFENLAHTVDNYKLYAGYMCITHMAQDAKGMQFYSWGRVFVDDGHNCSANSTTPSDSAIFDAVRSGIIEFVKMFTDANFQNACLWGKNMKGDPEGVGVTWTGPQDANYYYDAESLTYFDKQLGNCRYLGFSNSHWSDTCGVTMTGLPVGESITNIKTGDSSEITNSTMQFDVEREDWEMFKVSSGEPSVPVLTGPADQSGYAGSTASFNVVASGGGTYTYQWYKNGAPTVTTQTYTTEVLSAGNDGDQVYVFVTNSAGTTQSRTAALTVLDVPLSITQDVINPTRWIYKGQPITLIGGLWTHQPWAQTDVNMKSDLAALDAAGGNYHRCNMGLYPLTAITDKYHCTGSPGSFDLMTMVDENDGSTWWGMFKNYLTEMQRLGMCTTVELFDPWYHGYWEGLSKPEQTNNPWRPVNTSTYDETTSGLSNTLDSVAEFTALTHQDLIDAQEAYVTKLLSICSQFDNTLIQIDNESFALTPWTQHWIDFVHANSDLNVIDMNHTEDIDQPDARRGITLNTDGADLSQNGRTGSTIMEGDTAYRKATSYLAAMAGSASQRPVNSSKTYARATSGSSDADDNGLNSQGMYFCSDVGIVGQHKGDGTFDSQTDGLGGTTEGNNILTVMRSVDGMISRNEMSQIDIPAAGLYEDDNWWSREPNMAYAMSGGGKICVFFSQESDQLGVNILADEISTSSCRIDWIDADGSTGNIERTETIAKVDGFVNVRRLVAHERWFAVVSATT